MNDATSGSPVLARTNPFPGLRPFEMEESHLYFGRDGQSNDLIKRLRLSRFVAVVGTSGSGKSSLVRSGLLPSLYGGLMAGVGSSWRIAVLRPGEQPLRNLAATLMSEDVLGDSDASGIDVQIGLAETTMRRSGRGLIDLATQSTLAPEDNLLIVVDQFEEVFRFAESAQQAHDDTTSFVKLLLEATRGDEPPGDCPNIYVVLTMRSDFLGECVQFRDLPEAINDGQYLIPRMTRDQRREAITGPIAVGGAAITGRLVQRLLNDVGDNPDQLPILQHALMRTWDYWSDHHAADEPLDIHHYEAIGGMSAALSLHADEALNELDNRGRATARRLFKILTERGSDNRDVRRPTSIGDICAISGATEHEVKDVVEAFRAPGRSFLMPPVGVELNADSLIDISHESLIRNWQRLSGWVSEESQAARTYKRLAETAALHAEGRADLLQGAELAVARDWREDYDPTGIWAQRYHGGFEQAMRFLDESEAARQAEEAAKAASLAREQEQLRERAEADRKTASRLRVRARMLGFLVLLSAVAIVFAISLWRKAKGSENEALRSAFVAESLRLETDRLLVDAQSARDTAEASLAIAKEAENRALAAADNANQARVMANSLKAAADTALLNLYGAMEIVNDFMSRPEIQGLSMGTFAETADAMDLIVGLWQHVDRAEGESRSENEFIRKVGTVLGLTPAMVEHARARARQRPDASR